MNHAASALRMFVAAAWVMMPGVAAAGAMSAGTPGTGAKGTATTQLGGDAYYSPLTQINSRNVQDLGFAWDFKTGTTRGMEATPIVAGGILYASGPWGVVYALEASSGRLVWQFDPRSAAQVARYASVDVANRGIALARQRSYVTALDCRTFALDAHTGKVVWETATAEGPTYACAGVPLVAGDVLIVGSGGGDTGPGGLRGYVSAYDLDTGALRWRFHTVPKSGEAPATAAMQAAEATWDPDRDPAFGGGGTVWDGMSYDAASNRVFVGTGNAAPYLSAREKSGRPLDRLYAASIVALDAATGRLDWHFQTTPGDIWDYDACAKMILADLRVRGRTRHVLMQANKNGYFYVLDRDTGEPLSARPFTYVTWSTGMSKQFRPIVRQDADYSTQPRTIYPGAQGAHSWAPMSFNPATGLVYIPTLEIPSIIVNLPANPGATVKYVDGGTGPGFAVPDRNYQPRDLVPIFGQLPQISDRRGDGAPRVQGVLKAWDPVRQKLVWQRQTSQDYFVLDGGVLSTAGNLVFAGREDGRFVAYAADSGAVLKTLETGTATMAAPTTYIVDGTQYVAVLQGHGGSTMYSHQGTAAMHAANEGRILVLKLGGSAVPQPVARPQEPYRLPPARKGTPEQIASGRTLFVTWCSKCHNLGVPAVTPDLTRLNRGIGAEEVFASIVRRGALLAGGMPRFDDVLSSQNVADLHAYIIDQAWQAYDAEQKSH
jgi:quinohemoprotein ethanol dehydrogenase